MNLIPNPEHSEFLEFLEYLKNTPKEQLDKDYEELESWTRVGPLVDDFLIQFKLKSKNKN